MTTDDFKFKTDEGSEEKFTDRVKNRYLPLLMIGMAAIVIVFLLNIPTEMVL